MYSYNLLTFTPHTSNWSLQISFIMIICNLISIGLGRYAIQIRGLGPSIPVFGQEDFGLPELIATTSLGHMLGAGVIIGLSSIGAIS